jgi:hypothetical protein
MARDKPKLNQRSEFDLRHYGGDHRTQQARRFYTLRQGFANQLPGPPTGVQDVLLTQAATFALLAEREAAMLISEDPKASAANLKEYSRRSMALLTRAGIVSKLGITGHNYVEEDTEDEPEEMPAAQHDDSPTGLIASILAV